jgi:hypothetical protein
MAFWLRGAGASEASAGQLFSPAPGVNDSTVVDVEYDQSTDPVPKFGNHSNRRHADRVAMRNAVKNGVSEEDIDFYFGWGLRKMVESMRRHYAGLDRVLRLSLSRVTAWM